MREQIIKALGQSNFSEKYTMLCNDFSDIDNGISFKKSDLVNILNDIADNLKYSPREKLFYMDFTISGSSLRYVLPYKYGFIDCSYTIWNDYEGFRFRGSFAKLSKMVDEEFENKVKYKFPIATSLADLQKILIKVINLHKDFIEALALLA